MKSAYTTAVLVLLATGSLLAQDIIFTNKTATFTNLEGRVYTNVTLVKANREGLIWSGEGMGMVCYTNLSPALLKSLGIPVERIEQAKVRAGQRAAADAKQRAELIAAARGQAEAARQEALAKQVCLGWSVDGHDFVGLVQNSTAKKIKVCVAYELYDSNNIRIADAGSSHTVVVEPFEKASFTGYVGSGRAVQIARATWTAYDDDDKEHPVFVKFVP